MADTPRRIRVLVGKPGLDGHDRGARVIASALRDAGMEVVYTGLRASVPAIAATAAQEDVDVIGLSILSGAHLALCELLAKELAARGLSTPIIVGGVIPPSDVEKLRALGVKAVFGPESPLEGVVAAVRALAAGEDVPSSAPSPAPKPAFTALDHVGICVRDMDASCALYSKILNLPVAHREYVAAQDTHAAFFDLGNGAAIELVSPGGKNAGLKKFLDKRGDGLHHVCVRTGALDAALTALAREGCPLIDTAGRPGARGHQVGFLHPKALNGVLLELVQPGHHDKGETK